MDRFVPYFHQMDRFVPYFHQIVVYGGLWLVSFFVFRHFVRLVYGPKATGSRRLPPGPRAWPVLGHFHLFDRNLPFYRQLGALAERYGPVMHLQFGCRSVLVVSSSQMARECFTTNDLKFASRPAQAASKLLGYNSTMLGFNPYHHQCRNLRKICSAEFRMNIESRKHVRAEEVSSLVRSLFEEGERDGKKGIQMRPKLVHHTLNIIMRVVASKRFFKPDANDIDMEKGQALVRLIEQHTELLGMFNIGDFIPLLRCLDLQGCERKMKNEHKRADAFLQQLVDERRVAGGNKKPANLIDVLLSLSLDDSLVKATVMVILGAGTDTSSMTMEWALAALMYYPEIYKKAQEELDAHVGRDRMVNESDVPKLKYLQAVVKEIFRVYPAGPLLIPHQSIEACEVGGYYVEADTTLLVNAWAIHKDAAVWERPLEFDPERFMNSSIDPVRGQDFELIPFGSGRRICVGAGISLCVIHLTLATLLHSFDWKAPGAFDLVEGVHGPAVPKAVPLEALVTPRLPRHLYQF